MGIQVLGTFTSGDGLQYTNFYVRVNGINVSMTKPNAQFHVSASAYLNRDAYKNGLNCLSCPKIPLNLVFHPPTDDLMSVPLISYAYYLLSCILTTNAMEPVLEDGQTTYVPPESLVYVPPPPPPPLPDLSVFNTQ